ncbi:MAG: crossover junction endodeoxyribonuclease RuvC [Dysgonamonadaceae bacterium]|jgi:crossover junction endodeoxyribonuclease RuvC|nr:crossover junction endodeoxyribonuclease RuvC [Dysgonamonadaceae bacterium]
MTENKIILGVDPGTNITGYGLLKITDGKPSMIAMGVLELSKNDDHYVRLNRIFQRIISLIDEFKPDELAIESPFFGKNVQSMLKLGRAQGVAIAAAISRNIPVAEYAPLKIKLAITGNGRASKEQVADLLKKTLKIPDRNMPTILDATDGLAVALCHFYQNGTVKHAKSAGNWKNFALKNPTRIRK